MTVSCTLRDRLEAKARVSARARITLSNGLDVSGQIEGIESDHVEIREDGARTATFVALAHIVTIREVI